MTTALQERIAMLDEVEKGSIWLPRQSLRRLRREKLILEHGWEPYHIPREMFIGHLMGHGLNPWFLAWTTCIWSMFVGTLVGFLQNTEVGWGLYTLAFFLLGVVSTGALFTQPRLDLRVYIGPVPKRLFDKAKRDSWMFQEMMVGSMDRSLFENISDARMSDPFLLGRIDGDFYLGGQWDIGKELAHAPDPAVREES